MEAISDPAVDQDQQEYQEYLEATRDQQRIDALLRHGIIFSIIWLAGIGSTYALICTVRAMRIKRRSPYQLRGTKRILFCLLTSIYGVLFLGWLIVTVRNVSGWA